MGCFSFSPRVPLLHASPAHGAMRRAARTTRPYTARPTTEIHTSAANATGVFMLLWVVMIT